MSWLNKAKVNDILLFCDDWKTRNEIKNNFGMTDIESWHCARYISKLSQYIMVEKFVGKTKRLYRYKTRGIELKILKNELKL